MAVDTAAGMVKVSRKLLLDRTAEDNLLTEVEDSSVGTAEASTQLPSFPTTPPRQWSTQFFKHSVVGDK